MNNNGISFVDSNNTTYNVFSQDGGTSTTLGSFKTTSFFMAYRVGTVGSSSGVTSSSLTPATAVPWETDALPMIGSTVLIGLGFWAKGKFAKPLPK